MICFWCDPHYDNFRSTSRHADCTNIDNFDDCDCDCNKGGDKKSDEHG